MNPTQLPWREVPAGAVVLGRDSYQWSVISNAGGEVVMSREGRGEVTGRPPAGQLVTVLSLPAATERAAVTVLREQLGAEVLHCAWCADQDPAAECVCDENCGAKGCVNF